MQDKVAESVPEIKHMIMNKECLGLGCLEEGEIGVIF